MARFWRDVNQVIREADIILLIMDARFIPETKNKEIEDKVRDLEKPLIYVINKIDLVKRDDLLGVRQRLRPCVFVSTKEKRGVSDLRSRIIRPKSCSAIVSKAFSPSSTVST